MGQRIPKPQPVAVSDADLDAMFEQQQAQASAPQGAPTQQAQVPGQTQMITPENLALGGIPELDQDIQALSQLQENGKQDPITHWESFVLGLNKLQPEEQVKWMEKKGYKAKLGKDNELLLKKGSDYLPPTPEGFDTRDIMRWGPEFIIGGLQAIGTGAKASALGAAASGAGWPAVLPLAAVGTLAGAAGETAMQVGAMATGVRKPLDFDYKEIGLQSLMSGGIPGGLKTVGLAGKWAGGKALSAATQASRALGDFPDTAAKWVPGESGEIIRKGLRSIIAKNKPPRIGPALKDKKRIEEGNEMLKMRPTPGQMSDDEAVQMYESRLFNSPQTIASTGLKKDIASNQRRGQEAALEILEDAKGTSDYILGQTVKDEIVNSLELALKPVRELYSTVDRSLGLVPVNRTSLDAGFEKLFSHKEIYKSPAAKALLEKMRGEIGSSVKIGHLKDLRTTIFKELTPLEPGATKTAANELSDLLSREIDRGYDDAIIKLKKIGEPGSEEGIIAIRKNLKQANQMFREIVEKAEQGVMQGKKIRGNPRKVVIDKLSETMDPEKVVKSLQVGSSFQRAQALKNLSPKAFTATREHVLNGIRKKATYKTTAGSAATDINPSVVAKEIETLVEKSPELARLFFGDDALKKAKALAYYYRTIPKNYNPSGTAAAIAADNILNPMAQVHAMTLKELMNKTKSKWQLGIAAGEAIKRGEGGQKAVDFITNKSEKKKSGSNGTGKADAIRGR